MIIYGSLLGQEEQILVFTDNDSRGGLLKGDLIFTVPKTSSPKNNQLKIKDYVIYWGNNPHQRLGMFRPISKLPSAKPGSKMRLQFNKTRVPQSATHFLLYSRSESGNETEIYSLRLIDKGVPKNKAQDIFFEQTGKEGNRVQGEIRITRAWDERDVTHYAVYWGEGPDTVLRSQPIVTTIKKKSWVGNLFSQLQAPWKLNTLSEEVDVLLAPDATHLLVFSRNSEGQLNDGVSTEIDSIYPSGYRLEVSTPGINNSLKFPFQYQKNINRNLAVSYIENEVEIKVKGKLVKASDNKIELKYSDQSIIIYYEQIIDAKVLVSFK